MRALLKMICGPVLAAAWCTATAMETPYGNVTIPFELEQAPGAPVYYVIGQSGVPGSNNEGMTSNAGFVVTGDGVVVYDALGTPALGYRLLAAIQGVTDQPVRHVVAGHYHADHVYGLQAFKEHTDATIWAHENAHEYLNSPDAERRLAQRREALFPWVDEATHLVAPDRTFADEHTLRLGDMTLELVFVGPAHSASDSMMIAREAGVVFAGDIVFEGRLPFLGGGAVDTGNWLQGLERLQAMDPAPRFLIPGHGEPAADPRGAIAFTKGYLEFLRGRMGEAVDNFVQFEQAYEATDWSRYRDVPTFDEANRANAYSVYLEMEAEAFSSE